MPLGQEAGWEYYSPQLSANENVGGTLDILLLPMRTLFAAVARQNRLREEMQGLKRERSNETRPEGKEEERCWE